jgi:hypothetical protein
MVREGEFAALLGDSPAMRAIKVLLRKIAASPG